MFVINNDDSINAMFDNQFYWIRIDESIYNRYNIFQLVPNSDNLKVKKYLR